MEFCETLQFCNFVVKSTVTTNRRSQTINEIIKTQNTIIIQIF